MKTEALLYVPPQRKKCTQEKLELQDKLHANKKYNEESISCIKPHNGHVIWSIVIRSGSKSQPKLDRIIYYARPFPTLLCANSVPSQPNLHSVSRAKSPSGISTLPRGTLTRQFPQKLTNSPQLSPRHPLHYIHRRNRTGIETAKNGLRIRTSHSPLRCSLVSLPPIHALVNENPIVGTFRSANSTVRAATANKPAGNRTTTRCFTTVAPKTR